jgi:hypothetical protein
MQRREGNTNHSLIGRPFRRQKQKVQRWRWRAAGTNSCAPCWERGCNNKPTHKSITLTSLSLLLSFAKIMTPNLTTIGNDDDDLDVIFDWVGRSDHNDNDKATVAVATEVAIPARASSVGDAVAATTATSDDDNSGGSQQHHQEVVLAAGASCSDQWGPLPWMSDAYHHYHHTHSATPTTATASYDYYFKDHVDVIDFDASDCDDDDDDAFFGFARSNYMESIRTWTCGGAASQSQPTATIANSTTPVVSSLLLPMAMDMNTSIDVDDSEDDDGNNDECCPPGMVRTTSGSLSSEETADDDDETMSNASTNSSDSDAASKAEEDEEHQPPVLPPPQRGVTFNEQVRVLPIPPIEHYTPEQRYKMYANRVELRQNKLRNKREYEFDNYDWRNATEEHSMAICPVSGELLHPAHL